MKTTVRCGDASYMLSAAGCSDTYLHVLCISCIPGNAGGGLVSALSCNER